MKKKPLIVLTGPTAVGKTELSIQLAKAVRGEILSADSMQVYRGMDIGTAKIRPEDRQGVPHYCIDECNPDDEFNVMIFQKKAKAYMEEIYERGNIPILVGGTGFYIQSVLYDIAFAENQEQDGFREEQMRFAREKGVEALHARLCQVDRESADAIHPNNVKRVIRALEYFHFTGEKFSSHNERERKRESPYLFLYLVITCDRKILYERIHQRVDRMIEEGLVEEVHGLLAKGYTKELVSMQGLGYKELIPYVERQISLEEAVDCLKRDTRHFAKRQMTWFRREKEVIMLAREEYPTTEELLEKILCLARKKGMVT